MARRRRISDALVQTFSLGTLDGLVTDHSLTHEDDWDQQARFEDYDRPIRHTNRILRGGLPVRLRLWDERSTVDNEVLPLMSPMTAGRYLR